MSNVINLQILYHQNLSFIDELYNQETDVISACFKPTLVGRQAEIFQKEYRFPKRASCVETSSRYVGTVFGRLCKSI